LPQSTFVEDRRCSRNENDRFCGPSSRGCTSAVPSSIARWRKTSALVSAWRTEIGQRLYPKAPDIRQSATQSLCDGELFYIMVLPGFEWVATTYCGRWLAGTGIAKTRSVVLLTRALHSPCGSCRACRTCGFRFAGPTIAWNSCGIPQALGNRCAIPPAPTGPAAVLFFNVDKVLRRNHNIWGLPTQNPEAPI
jgi:hypothetical protein